MAIEVFRIYRYPVKGLSAEPMERVTLSRGECLPHDRRFALARPTTKFDPSKPEWLPKANFIMLMRDERLAGLKTRFHQVSGQLMIERDHDVVLRAALNDQAGRETLEKFFAEFLGDTLGGRPRLVEAPGHTFSDAKQKPNATTYKYVSIINLASIRALEEIVQAPIDPLRFRGNVYIDGLPAWEEFDWVESHITIGTARLHIVSRIVRCAATQVNPVTAKRDINIPAILQQAFGHGHMGVYGEVVEGGEIAVGDQVLQR